MKLVALALATILATACYAQAEPAPVYAGPPGGFVGYGAPVQVVPVVPVVPVGAPPRATQVQDLRAEILARFDHNGDGQLDPRELRQAMHALHRLEHQLQREDRRERRAERMQRRQMQRMPSGPSSPQGEPRNGDPGF